MLIWACAGSINSRFASGDKASFFFQPVQLHFELSNVLVELRLERLLVVLALGASCRENLGHLLLETVLPVGIVSKPVQKLMGKLTLFHGISQVLSHRKTP